MLCHGSRFRARVEDAAWCMHEAIPREGDELKESRALFPRIQKAFRKCDAGTAVQDVPAAGSTRATQMNVVAVAVRGGAHPTTRDVTSRRAAKDLVLKGLPEVSWIDYCEITLSPGARAKEYLSASSSSVVLFGFRT